MTESVKEKEIETIRRGTKDTDLETDGQSLILIFRSADPKKEAFDRRWLDIDSRILGR